MLFLELWNPESWSAPCSGRVLQDSRVVYLRAVLKKVVAVEGGGLCIPQSLSSIPALLFSSSASLEKIFNLPDFCFLEKLR